MCIRDRLEALWKALPDYVQNDENTLVVRDGSGSMMKDVYKRQLVQPGTADCDSDNTKDHGVPYGGLYPV